LTAEGEQRRAKGELREQAAVKASKYPVIRQLVKENFPVLLGSASKSPKREVLAEKIRQKRIW